MKKSSLILAIIFLISICSSYQVVNAQTKTKEEKEKEFRLQEAIDAQKKAIAEQQKAEKEAQQEVQRAMQERDVAIDEAMKNVKVKVEDPEKLRERIERSYRVFDDYGINRVLSNGEPFSFAAPNIEIFHSGFNDDAARTSWNFSKSVKEASFSRDYTVDVDPAAKSVVMSVNGDCKSGEIHIKIVMPNGKTYSDIVIDEFGDLNWRKSFTISDTENKDKAGAWKFEINSSKATGFFRISLQTS